MRAFEHGPLHLEGLSALENQILREKARGLSNLEVASKLFLSERQVRAVTQRLKKRRANGYGGSTKTTPLTPKE